jgi:hypothetical protein
MYAICSKELTHFLNKAINAVCTLSETLVVTVNANYLILSAADAHEAGMLCFHIPNRKFLKFAVREGFTHVYRSSEFKEVFCNQGKYELLQLRLLGNCLDLMWVTQLETYLEPQTVRCGDETSNPKRKVLVNSDAVDISVFGNIPIVYRSWSRITITGSELVLIINEMAIYGTHIRMQLDSEKFTISTSNELGVFRLYIDKIQTEQHRFVLIHQVSDDIPVDCTYVTKYLLPIMNYGFCSEKLDLFIANGQPLIISDHVDLEPGAQHSAVLPRHILCTSPILES